MTSNDPRPVELTLPFAGRWLVQNSPARRVPSHGVDVLGQRYAIDFVGVDDTGRSSAVRDWRTVLSTEPPERFVGFGRPILAPVAGRVVEVHDGEVDHVARRSQLALLPYALSQAARVRAGVDAVAGNRVVLADRDSGAYVALVHLRAGSLHVTVGDEVTHGEVLAECGNSGNSTEPHVHLQAMDRQDVATAEGLPIVFRQFREHPPGATTIEHTSGLPGERSIVEPL